MRVFDKKTGEYQWVPPVFKGEGNYDTDAESTRTAFVPVGESETEQDGLQDADINVMMQRAGVLPTDPLPRIPISSVIHDFTNAPADFAAAVNLVSNARDAFMSLDPRLRNRFGGNPQELIDFAANPENFDEAVRLGILVPRAPAGASAPTGVSNGVGATPPAGGGQPPAGGS